MGQNQSNAEPQIVSLDGIEAEQYAELASVMHDLYFISKGCAALLEQIGKGSSGDDVLVEALWTAVLITYARCFAEGKRMGLKADDVFSKLKGETLKVHDYYINTRNKHVAHSVNAAEQMIIAAVLTAPASGRDEVENILTFAISPTPTSVGVKQLANLVAVLRHEVGQRSNAAQAAALEAAKRIPMDELRSRPNVRVGLLGPEHEGRPRKSILAPTVPKGRAKPK